MKKSNIIIFAILAAASAFLLWLWYYLGLYHIDDPLDLVLSVIWWVVIIVAIVVIVRVEKARQERVRAVYVSEDLVFNSEIGSFPYDDPVQLVSIIENILQNLKYNFSKEDLPNKNAFPIEFIVQTHKYNNDEWTGNVVNVETKKTTPFNGREELFRVINGLRVYNKVDYSTPIVEETVVVETVEMPDDSQI